MEAPDQHNADSIIKLPRDVMQLILTFLPVKDAAKTATLSRQWRHNWRSNTRFVFDSDFGEISEEGDYGSKANALMLAIYRALLVHDGPVTKFMLKIPGLRPCPDINHIVHFLAKKGVQEVALIFIDNEDDGSWREMPSALFSARELSSLILKDCDFSRAPSWFLGFTKLTHLWLESVDADSGFYDDFLPKCPLLKHLTLFIRDTNAMESRGKAELVAPSLEVFKSNVWNICFRHTPLLSEVVIETQPEDYARSDFGAYNPDVAAVFASLPAIQKLFVSLEWMKFLASGNFPVMLPTRLCQLKSLENQIVLYHSSEARLLLCLIRSSPNLQRLYILLCDAPSSLPPTELIDSLQLLLEAECVPPASCFQCLEEFAIHGFTGTLIELDLVRLALTSAPQLRTLFIYPEVNSDLRKDVKVLMEVTRYKRASTEAEVRYVWKEQADTS
ncbi:unnamed protein product [Linum tenue]|uniref:F-box domain-containing protein n=1 Tax=Linum tenue TaxID=586396 RepID=A0AAV0NIL6_9ROSI|nr:unnamed protein product [Linum tenue]